MSCPGPHLPRRTLLGLLGLGAAGVLAGCGAGSVGSGATSRSVPSAGSPAPTAFPALPPTGPGRPEGPLPDGPRVFAEGSPAVPRIALTVDDGYCADCVAGYTDFAVQTGIPLTLSPNGTYGPAWRPHADALAPLVERGQLQIINHTFTHRRLLGVGAPILRDELERNEAWIESTFHATARPWWRPPFGAYDAAVERAAAALGYDRLVMWSGSYSDSEVVTPQFLLGQAAQAYRPGAIVLGHANHPTVLGLFPQLLEMLRDRGLQPVTLRALLDPT